MTHPEDVLAHWCEHYTELLNHYPIYDESVLRSHWATGANCLLWWSTFLGRNKHLIEIDNNKTPGMDGITTEILKCGGDKMIDLFEQVIHDVWESEPPQDWRNSILLSLHKKGS